MSQALAARGHNVDVADPLADPEEAKRVYGLPLVAPRDGSGRYDAVVGAVAHDDYRTITGDDLGHLLVGDGLVADIKGMWRGLALADGLRRWSL